MSRRRDGFTLLELMIVIFLIVLITGVFVGSIGTGFGVHIRNSARSLAAELEYVSQRAVTTGHTQRFVMDLDHQVFRVEMQVPPPDEVDPNNLPTHAEGLSLAPPIDQHQFVPVDTSLGQWRALDDADEVTIREVRLGTEKRSEGVVAVGFSIDGSTDPAEIWLRDSTGFDVRVRLVAFTGEIHIEEPPREP
ncbi:MAG TPA: prepilin-type N-terminal cleavage/methylation domain-containing protein [Myxococcota bacterium]|nr:prepilin-type N-terminal cleavage/methylation domain-containing protein [Myxococcota bacterium]